MKSKELNDIFIDFIKMRKTKIKNGEMTERAIKIMVNGIRGVSKTLGFDEYYF